MKEFTIVLFGLECIEMHDLVFEIRRTGNPVAMFDKSVSFIEFLNRAQDQQVVLILSNCIDEILMPLIHSIPQLHSIYVLGTRNDKNEEWTKTWEKVIGIFDDIRAVCHELKQITRENKRNIIPISITSVSSNTDLNTCSPSFMSSQILTDILLQIRYNEKIKQDFVDCVHHGFTINDPISLVVNKLKSDYNCSSPIWWYTKESCIYSLLNKALKEKDIDTVIKMRHLMGDIHNRCNRLQFLTTYNDNSLIDEGITELTDGFSDQFLQKVKRHQIIPNTLAVEAGSIYDLYQQIEQLHLKTDQPIQMTLYRGQGLSSSDFEEMMQNRGGLLSFNNFLSTSTDRNVSFAFAESAQMNPDLIGVLFQISIDTSISRKPFTTLNNIGYSISEEEILLSMHTVFRIVEMKCVKDRLWQVDLTLSDDYNKKFRYRLWQFRQNVTKESTRLRKLGLLMINMGEFEKAEKIYKTLSETEFESSWEELAYIYNRLGYIKKVKNDFNRALTYYRMALEIRNDNLSYNRPELARLLTNIGMVQKSLGHFSRGILYLRRALDIQQKSLTFTYPDVVMTYNNIGQLYSSKGEYTTSLSYFQKAIKIQQNSDVPSYPFLAIINMNMGQVYYSMGDSSTALKFLQKALKIHKQKSSFIPTELVEIYNIVYVVHKSMENHMIALTSFPKPSQIQRKYLSFVHPDIANKDGFTAEQAAADDEIKDLFKAKKRSKSDSKHFVVTMAEVEWLDLFKNNCRISCQNGEHMKRWLSKVRLEKLLNEIDTSYIDKMGFSNEESKNLIKDYLKLVIDWEQPSGLVHAYTGSRTGVWTKLNQDLTKIGSKVHFPSTQDLFNSGYLDNEAPKGLGQHTLAAILINHSFFQPYYYTGTVYRGINMTPDDLKKYETGMIVMTCSFLSTSKDPNMAKLFMSVNEDEKQPVMCKYKITNPRSSLCIKDVSEFSMEKEVLILPFTVFRIIKGNDIGMGVSDINNPIKVIRLEEC
jgi:tetratricopeptide (TPR) repeat protein